MALDQEVEALKRKLSEQNSEMNTLKKKLDEKEEEVDSSKSKIAKQDHEVEALKRKLNERNEEFDSEVNTLKKKLDEKEEEVDSSRNKITKQDHVLKQLQDKIECPVCLDIPRSGPVPVCPNGHVVCKTCKRDICPTCRTGMGTATSLLASTVLRNIEHKCKFENCNKKSDLEDLKKHEAVCPHRTVNCPSPMCSVETPLGKLGQHIKNSKTCFGAFYRALKDWNRINYCLKGGMPQSNHFWQMYIYSYSDEAFAVFPLKSGDNFFFLIVMFNSEEECSKYEVEMIVHERGSEVTDSAMAVKFYGNPLSIDLKKEEQKLYSTGEKMMTKIVKKSIDGAFSLSFKISKKGELQKQLETSL